MGIKVELSGKACAALAIIVVAGAVKTVAKAWSDTINYVEKDNKENEAKTE